MPATKDESNGPIALNGRFLAQPVTGVQRYALEILNAAERLAAIGQWPATEILTPPIPPGESLAADHHFPVREVGRSTGQRWEQTELFRHAKPHLLLSLGNTAPILSGGRQIVVIHDAGAFDTPESYSFPFRNWYKFLHRRLAGVGARIVTVSRFSQHRLAERLRVPAETITVVREGADHILRVPPEPQVLARNDLEPGRFAFAVGSRAAHKNLGALRSAAEQLSKRKMKLAIAGALDTNVFRSGADGVGFDVTALGRVSDGELRTLYENAVALLFPSRYEGFGLPAVEALACGCPLIAAGGHSVEEVCAGAALFFDPADREGAGNMVARLLDHEDLSRELTNNGKSIVANITWENAARDLAAVTRNMSVA
ncbi:MAG: glycosyltransferase family 1 protein [Pseudomonadota bacterium]